MFRKFGFIVVAGLVAFVFAGAVSAAPPSTLTPVAGITAERVAVPAEVLAAHPGGTSGVLSAVAASSTSGPRIGPIGTGTASSCWRAYFTGDNSLGWFGTEQQHINPFWCGNGYAMRGVDSGWHWQSCTWLVSCTGQDGPATWGGCANGCWSIGQQIVGHFVVYAGFPTSVDITVLYELYGNGQYWDYEYHN